MDSRPPLACLGGWGHGEGLAAGRAAVCSCFSLRRGQERWRAGDSGRPVPSVRRGEKIRYLSSAVHLFQGPRQTELILIVANWNN